MGDGTIGSRQKSLDDYGVTVAEKVPPGPNGHFPYQPACKAKWDDLREYHRQLRAHHAAPSAASAPDIRLLVGDSHRPELQALGPARRLSIEYDPRDGTPAVGMRFEDSTKGDFREVRVFDAPVAYVFLCLWLPGSGGGLNPREKLGTGPLYGYHSWGNVKAYWRRLIADAPVNTREVDPIKGDHFPFGFRSHLIRDFGARKPILPTDHQTRASWIGRQKAIEEATARYRSGYQLPCTELDFRQMLLDGFVAVDKLWVAFEELDGLV